MDEQIRPGDSVTPTLSSSWFYKSVGIVRRTNSHGAFVWFPTQFIKNMTTFFPFKEIQKCHPKQP